MSFPLLLLHEAVIIGGNGYKKKLFIVKYLLTAKAKACLTRNTRTKGVWCAPIFLQMLQSPEENQVSAFLVAWVIFGICFPAEFSKPKRFNSETFGLIP